MNSAVMVFGPVYLDRVLRVGEPLLGEHAGGPLDRSMRGTPRFARGRALRLVDRAGHVLEIDLPVDWPGPFGRVELEGLLAPGAPSRRRVTCTSWNDDLGGMGAGFTAALGGTLVHALGPVSDPVGCQVEELLRRNGIRHHVFRVPDRPADWTLLVSSGEHGDKLAVGLRGCHESVAPEAFDPWLKQGCGLRVVAGLPNRLAAHVLNAPGAGCRLFAPAMRNMQDRECPVSDFAAAIDVLCCNRLEWETAVDREDVGWRVSVLVVTDGAAGAWARFTGPVGETQTQRVPVFPRSRPPRDTNRAGEAFAAALVSDLLESGWQARTGLVEPDLLKQALLRASAAAALVLDQTVFGFPDKQAIDHALREGRVD